jgi:hypothetical protein
LKSRNNSFRRQPQIDEIRRAIFRLLWLDRPVKGRRKNVPARQAAVHEVVTVAMRTL